MDGVPSSSHYSMHKQDAKVNLYNLVRRLQYYRVNDNYLLEKNIVPPFVVDNLGLVSYRNAVIDDN
jgi:hypothetical protein